MDVLDYKESWAPKNWCFWTVGEDSWESLGLQGDPAVHPKGDQSWVFIGRTDAEAETPILWPPDAKNWLHWKRPWWWERLKAGGEGYDRGWDGWMTSLTQWTWVWVGSGNWWWTGRPGVLQSMGSQRITHNWATELNWTELMWALKNKLSRKGWSLISGRYSQGWLPQLVSKKHFHLNKHFEMVRFSFCFFFSYKVLNWAASSVQWKRHEKEGATL